MPITILTLIVVGTAVNLVSCQPPIFQTSQFGTQNSDNGITSMDSDSTGVYATGIVGYDNVTPSYLFVSKYDSNGQQVWTQHLGNATSISKVLGVGVGTDGVYTVGALSISANASFVRKYNLSGNLLWNAQFGNPSTSDTASTAATAVSASATNVYVAGLDLASNASYFLRSYDLNGNLVWSRLMGNNSGTISVFASPTDVYTAYDTVYTLTEFSSLVQSYDTNGILLWTRTCSCSLTGIAGDSSGVYVTGLVLTSERVPDGFLGKYSLDGTQLWNTSFSDPGEVSVESVEVTADSSGVYLASTTASGRGIVMKYNRSGGLQWSLQLPGRDSTGVWTHGDVIATGAGEVYVGGELQRSTSSTDYAFISFIGESNSLIFFGLNPPLSFGILALLAGGAVSSILLPRRFRKSKLRHAATSMRPRSQENATAMYT